MVALVVDDQSHVPPAQHLCQALLVQRADRADQHAGVRRSAQLAALDGHHGGDGRAAQRSLQLVAGLRQQLLTVGEHQHLPPRELRQVREDHSLAGARGQVDEQPALAGAARRQHGLDRGALIGTKVGWERWRTTWTSYLHFGCAGERLRSRRALGLSERGSFAIVWAAFTWTSLVAPSAKTFSSASQPPRIRSKARSPKMGAAPASGIASRTRRAR